MGNSNDGYPRWPSGLRVPTQEMLRESTATRGARGYLLDVTLRSTKGMGQGNESWDLLTQPGSMGTGGGFAAGAYTSVFNCHW